MKRIRKIFVIISLSFLMTSALIPQREKEAHAFVLTGTMVLGALAVAGMGGVVAYHNRDAIATLGAQTASKLEQNGISVSDMFTANRYGLTDTVKKALSDSINDDLMTYRNSVVNYKSGALTAGQSIEIDLPTQFLSSLTAASKIIIDINYTTEHGFPINLSGSATMKIGSSAAYWLRDAYYGPSTVNTENRYMTTISSSHRGHSLLLNAAPLNIGLVSSYSNTAKFDITVKQYETAADRMAQDSIESKYQGIDIHQDSEALYNTLSQNYGNNIATIDYERLADIMSGTSTESITMDNINTLITSMENIGGAVEDAGADTVGVLTTIWNGIKNIPSLIQSSSTAVLGGISSLTDDLLTGLGNFTGNITAANEQLWNDAGAVWSGLVENINTANNIRADYTDGLLDSMRGGIDNIRTSAAQNTSDLLERLSTGIDNIRDFTGSNATAIGNNIATGIDNIKTITSTNTAIIGDKIQTAATSITDRVTSAATSITDTITGIAVPSTSAIDDYKIRITTMNEKFKKKFEFIMGPIGSLKDLYSKPKSLFDVEMVLMDTKVRVLPESFRSSVAYIKPLLNGVIVLLTFMSIYKKIQGKEVV